MWRNTLSAVLVAAATSVAPADAGVIFFANDVAGFTAAMAGSSLVGVEDFEGSNLAPDSVLAIDDPLAQGVANGSYAAGLSVPLTVQSNTVGDGGSTSPRGPQGLAAASAGFGGAVSDVVVANFFEDSLDLIFSGDVTGVGFDTVNFFDLGDVSIQVFDPGNVLLGGTTIQGDPTAANFLGIQATAGSRIGRINIKSLTGGAEGADNVRIYTDVPEPSILALLVAGLAGGQMMRRRRAR